MSQNPDPDVLANSLGRMLGCGAIAIFIAGLLSGFLAGLGFR